MPPVPIHNPQWNCPPYISCFDSERQRERGNMDVHSQPQWIPHPFLVVILSKRVLTTHTPIPTFSGVPLVINDKDF